MVGRTLLQENESVPGRPEARRVQDTHGGGTTALGKFDRHESTHRVSGKVRSIRIFVQISLGRMSDVRDRCGTPYPTMLLTVTGRKTGKPRTVPVIYIEEGDRFVIAAAYSCSDTDPTWWLVPRPELRAVHRRDRTEEVDIDRAQSSAPQTAMFNDMENFEVRDRRELMEIGQQNEHVVALLDRTECQLFDDQVMAANCVVGQQADEMRLGGVQMIDPYRRINENHRQMASPEGRPMPANPCRQGPPSDGHSPPGSMSAIPDGAVQHSRSPR